MSIIEIEHLTKKFKDLVAVDDISFEVEEGEVFGLLGPNGAGKSTLISTLCTLLYSTTGTARISGYDINTEASKVRKNIGIVFQEIILDDLLTGKENLRFFAKLGNMPKIERENKIEDLLHLVDLYNRKNDQVKYYSGGMKRRLEIARGLLFDPKVLFLDEATLGLDAQNRRIIWDYILRLNKEKSVTVFLTTHYIEEADISNRVAIIDLGKVIELATPNELKSKIGDDFVEIMGTSKNSEELKNSLSSLSFVERVFLENKENHDEYKVYCTISSDESIPILIQECLKLDFKFKSITNNKPTLEDVFIHYTGRQLRDEFSTEKTSKANWRSARVRNAGIRKMGPRGRRKK
ncbi:MAG: ATP-binding cassette domain-containing protein [Candidatus Helarchaeota archaeon]